MIEALAQAVAVQPTETYALADQLVCSSLNTADVCAFTVAGVGPGQALLTCVVHLRRLLATEKAVGTSHAHSAQRMIAAEGRDAGKGK